MMSVSFARGAFRGVPVIALIISTRWRLVAFGALARLSGVAYDDVAG